jgi:hypothetical protein
MEKILAFVTNHYIIFIVITVILVLALIGRLAQKSASKDVIIKTKKEVVNMDNNQNPEQK